MLDLQLVVLVLKLSQLVLVLFDAAFELPLGFVVADHVPLQFLVLGCLVAQLLHQRLCLLLVGPEQAACLLEVRGEMGLLTSQPVVVARQYICRQFHFRDFLLLLLHFVLSQVELVLDLADAVVVLSQLLRLPVLVTFQCPQLLHIVGHSALVLHQILAEPRVLRHFLIELILQTLVRLLVVGEVLTRSHVFGVEVSVLSMHFVELLLKLEPQLDLFFVVPRVLGVLFLQLEAHLPLVHPLLLQGLRILLQNLHVLLDDLLVVGLLGELGLVLRLQALHFLLVLQ